MKKKEIFLLFSKGVLKRIVLRILPELDIAHVEYPEQSKNIRAADEKAGYDAACKRLLSEKIILAWIMKNCLEEYRDCDVNEIADSIILNKIQEKFHLTEEKVKMYL